MLKKIVIKPKFELMNDKWILIVAEIYDMPHLCHLVRQYTGLASTVISFELDHVYIQL